MLTATKSGTNIILKTSVLLSFNLERKLNTGSWESWTGSGWGGVPLDLSEVNFTDYDLSDGIYQYRTFTTEYEYSTCIPIGSDHVGWTFQNYTVPTGHFGEILTPDDLHYSFLWGIDLTASNGEAWSDAQTKTLIEWSVAQLEKKLNIHIFQRTIYCDDENNDDIEEEKYVIKEFPYPNRRNQRYNLRMRHRPVREVTRFDFYSPQDVKILDLLQWMRVDKRNGQLNYKPKQTEGQTFTMHSYPWGLLLNGYGYRDAFHVDYKTGYKTAEFLPEDLRDIVGKIAALKALNVIGDGLLAGFSSSSISLDGMSESFSSTQSATSAYFGARIKVYQDEIKEYLEENKNKYGNFRIGSF